MPLFEDEFGELRESFVREARGRLARIEQALEHLAAGPADAAALETLMRCFHAFAGAGTSYGFPRVTALGQAGERETLLLSRTGARPRPEQILRWRELAGQLREDLTRSELPHAAPPAPAPPRRQEVLIAYRDKALRATAVSRIQGANLITRTAGSLQAALGEISRQPIDALVTDVRLPDGSGYELVEKLRQLPGGELPAALMITGGGRFLDKVEAIRCGADGHFEMPVDWDALMRRLQWLLERARPEAGRILYVEDDREQAAYTRRVLESGGFEVRICDDPRRFEADLAAFAPDLVIMDILLPGGVTGYELARLLRQDERHATLPVLFLTTQGQLEARIESARAGGDEHLLKPVAPGLLLSSASARIERARLLKRLLDRDGLTGLLTHTAFLERARVALNQAQRQSRRSTAWVMIDVDRFKTVNDRYGHPAGDRVLSQLASLLRRRLRQSDSIGRYGGEEFAVLLEDLDTEQTVRLVDRLREEFAALDHAAPDGGCFRATFSAGVALADPARMDLSAWAAASGEALALAKRNGRNCVASAAPS